MNIGDLLLEEDLDAIREIHAQSGFDYKLPAFANNPRFPIQLSIRHEGDLMGAVLAHVDAEIYLFLDHCIATPEVRYQALEALQDELIKRARMIGFDTMYCVLPPEIERSFGPRLVAHGWKPDRGWKKFTRDLV